MHRATPASSSFRAFSSGGARSVVDKVDDKKMMQEMGGNFMKGETRDKVEAPQNYGFTSVVMPATKGKDGQISESAEAFISFIGGNRSFPVCGVMDDRRYRLKELKEGDVAFYDHLQHQFHMNKDGVFLTGRDDKKVKFQLVEKPQEEQQQQQTGSQGGATPTQQAESGASSGASSGGQQQKKKGQTARYEKESKKFIDINKDKTQVEHDKDIGVKSGKTLALEGTAIKRKADAHYFDGDVHITGNLRISKNAYKPSDGEWLAGTANPPPSDDDDPAEYVLRAPPPLTAEQEAYLARKRALADKIKITDDGVFIDGDFTVTGNLTVTGIVRAKDFVKVR